MPSAFREFDGEKYKLFYSNLTLTFPIRQKEKWAEERAARIRRRGNKARIVRCKTGYAVYEGPKRKEKPKLIKRPTESTAAYNKRKRALEKKLGRKLRRKPGRSGLW